MEMDKLFSFKGCVGRLNFFLTTCFITILTIIGLLFLGSINNKASDLELGLYIIVFLVVIAWLSIAAAVKRLRDAGIHLGIIALLFIPGINNVINLLLLIIPGKGFVCPNCNTNINSANTNYCPKCGGYLAEQSKNNSSNYNGVPNEILLTSIVIGIISILIIMNIAQGFTQNAENKPVKTSKQLSDYYKEGVNYCSNIKHEGNGSFSICISEYIDRNANPSIIKQYNDIYATCSSHYPSRVGTENCVFAKASGKEL